MAEEDKGKKVLAQLEKMGVDNPDFASSFRELRNDVLRHAEREEAEEHPRLAEAVDEDRRRKLGTLFRSAEATAPTHAHAASPESAVGNMVVGPFVAAADRARDALRNAKERMGT
jgi:hypothetical protein